ncbi:hypothetical protein HHI36_011619 [Cryptolaemus montrouzieri]|uniref:Uncharacterized protein n=1 Tax=Cryptolaemus montrouzieri TaxID=559131 RepID=A0ABD2MM67_9CUCU
MYISALLVAVLIQYTLGYNEENYPYSDNYETNMMYPDDYQDQDNDMDPIQKRGNSNFVRFGRSHPDEPDPRPTRGGKMLRNDYFVRFGRSKQDYLRFGRDPTHQRYTRSKGDYVRFGRSVPATSTAHRTRSKREATFEPENKRNSNFLRFGRNSNFLRFGRNKEDFALPNNQEIELTQEDIKALNKLRQFFEVPLLRLFTQLEPNGQDKCKNNM